MTQARVRYEPEEGAPPHLALGAALQAIAAMVMTTTLIPTVIGHHAGLPRDHIQWMLFSALIAAAVIALLQPQRIGRLGSGLVMLGGAAPAFIGVSGLALSHGGIALLSLLSLCSLPMVLLFARQAHRFRRVLRPPVMGTLLMLVAASLAQTVWRIGLEPPREGQNPWINLGVTAITFAAILLINLLARSSLRYLAPVGGLLIGLMAAWSLGAIPGESFGRETLLGIPAYPLTAESFRVDLMFFALLPAFLVLQVVTSMESFSCSRLSQSLSYRKPDKPDQRKGQGAVLVNGIGTLTAALLGALPTTTYSSSVSILGMTGVMSRRVGFVAALILLAVAFSPQLISFVVNFPAPVAAGYLLFIVVLIFNNGVRMATEDGLDAQEGVIVFTGFWTGITLQTGLSGAHLGAWGAVLSSSGTAIGGILTLLMILIMDFRTGEKARIAFLPTPEGFAALNGSVSRHVRRRPVSPQSSARLHLCCEEATQLLVALREANPAPWPDGRINMTLRAGNGVCHVEAMTFPAAGDFAAMEQRARGAAGIDPAEERLELASLRILASLAHDIRHIRYHDVDILSFTVPVTLED